MLGAMGRRKERDVPYRKRIVLGRFGYRSRRHEGVVRTLALFCERTVTRGLFF